MIGTPVPVTLGSPRSRAREIDAFSLVHAWFPPATRIAPHTHDYPVLAVMLGGSFDLSLSRREHHCPAASVMIEPAGEVHGNRMHRAGADVMIIQPDPARRDRWAPFARLFARPATLRHGGVHLLAVRLAQEVSRCDPLAGLAAESLALEILVCLARVEPEARQHQVPGWVAAVADAIRDQPPASLSVGALAAMARVSPGHLARVFRATYHVSLGTYARRFRLERAADRLRHSDDSIAAIAARAGFADQSHLTRAIKAVYGVTPARYRACHRDDGGASPPG